MTAMVDSAVADLQRANADLRWRFDEALAERGEALAQQTAIAELLGVIHSSPGDLVPVFDAMLEEAMRLCQASFGALVRYDGALFRIVANRNVPQSALSHVADWPTPISLTAILGGSPFRPPSASFSATIRRANGQPRQNSLLNSKWRELMDLILIIIVLFLVWGGGFGYSRWGYGGGIGIGGILLIVLVVYLLVGRGRF
jgi:hypothetical protein